MYDKRELRNDLSRSTKELKSCSRSNVQLNVHQNLSDWRLESTGTQHPHAIKRKHWDLSSLCPQINFLILVSKRWKHPPISLIIWGSSSVPKSRPFRYGQDFLVCTKKCSSPLNVPSIFFNYVQLVERTFAPQLFVVVEQIKYGRISLGKSPTVVRGKVGSPVPGTPTPGAMLRSITSFSSWWLACLRVKTARSPEHRSSPAPKCESTPCSVGQSSRRQDAFLALDN